MAALGCFGSLANCFSTALQSGEGARLDKDAAASGAPAQVAMSTANSIPVMTDAHLPSVLLTLGPELQLRTILPGSITSDDSGFEGSSTGASPWWGNLLLTAWIAHGDRSVFSGRRVLELGCGNFPLPAVAASMCGATLSVATDGSEANVHIAQSTLDCNPAVCKSCSVRRLKWENNVAEKDTGSWDVVLFADVLYKFGIAPILAKVIASLLHKDGLVIGAVGLHRSGSSEIFHEMQCLGFCAQQIPVLGPVFSSALQSSTRLLGARTNGLGVSMDVANNECILVRWVWQGHPLQVGADMAETLCDQVLNAPYCQAETAQRSGWEPSE